MEDGELSIPLECEFVAQVDNEALVLMTTGDGEPVLMLVQNEVEA